MENYTGTYKVFRVFKVSGRREIIRRDLTRDEAINLVKRYAHNNRSMVVFDKQFTAAKYYN
jgi:hypothetical protein